MPNYTNEQLDSVLMDVQARSKDTEFIWTHYNLLIRLIEDLRQARQDNATLEVRIAKLERKAN